MPYAFDQRGLGFNRVVGDKVDIGAFEVQALRITTSTLPNGTYGSPYRQTIAAAEAGLSAFTFSLADGSLPPGLTLAGDGTLSGTPSAQGWWTFTVQAQDTYGFTARQTLTLFIPLVATIQVTGYSVPYDGNPHTATGTVTGVLGFDLSAGFDLNADLNLGGTQHTGAGSYTDTWTFHDPNGIYADASGTVSDTISPESLTISAVSDSKTYDGGTLSSKSPTVVGTIYNNEVSYSQAFQSKDALGSGGGTLVVSYTISAGATGWVAAAAPSSSAQPSAPAAWGTTRSQPTPPPAPSHRRAWRSTPRATAKPTTAAPSRARRRRSWARSTTMRCPTPRHSSPRMPWVAAAAPSSSATP
jgi:hypothetical protein